jgi:hypothetical protein
VEILRSKKHPKSLGYPDIVAVADGCHKMWDFSAHLVGMDKTGARAGDVVDRDDSVLPPGFDVAGWVWQACQASGVPFAVADPIVLGRLRTLVAHPG